MRIFPVFILLGLLCSDVSLAARSRPNLVPSGWTLVSADPERKIRRFESPDGRSMLMSSQTRAHRAALDQDMDAIAYRDNEQITYQQRGASWIAVSGYRGDDFFYRKSNLACGGTRWHNIALRYPRTE